MQDARPLLDFGVARCPLFGQRRQKARQTVWAEQPVGEMGCDKTVEPVHGDGSAFAVRLSDPGSCALSATPFEIEAVNQPHRLDLDRIDNEFLLGAVATLVHPAQRIPER
ncbi:hypothetical protein [Methylocystis sp.]|uniref:hypothetical protein n=1 Tax=Methylocystis sp. TaxID=1911079 RepID=UPI003DA6B125